MSKILIWRTPTPGGDVDIFSRTDYRMLFQNTKNNYSAGAGNWGNKVWYQGIISVIDTPENEIVFRTTETKDEINSNFDMVIYPMANFFSRTYCKDTSGITKDLSGLRIPVYIIACGAQAQSYEELDELVRDIGEQSKRFIETVYQTGGEFALRGRFTKEFFSRLGFPTAVATGCPSLFQMGPDLTIRKGELDEEYIKPIINGKIKGFERILRECPKGEYFDQDTFISCLYNADYFHNRSLKRDILFYRNYSIYQAQLLAEGRIKFIADLNDWLRYIREGAFDYSFGTKIHGSIMPILAGIPATVLAIDSRTREMAEFFDIPWELFRKNHRYSKEELIESYRTADYTQFNLKFRDRFAAFERFLQERGIVSKINTENRFFNLPGGNDYDEYQPNRKAFMAYAEELAKKKPLLFMGSLAFTMRSWMKRLV